MTKKETKYDLSIIGGGPGGYSAAIRASQLGLSVCLYEPNRLGGTCLNTGCIPTKALYRSAEVYKDAKSSEEFGIICPSVNIDFEKVQGRKKSVVEKLVSGVEQLIEGNKIDLIPEYVTVSKAKENASNVIIATGSSPAKPPIPGVDLPGVIDSEEILSLPNIPKSLVIIGGGVMGIEFANIFGVFGAEVTIMEVLPEILPPVDKEIKKRLIPMMKANNIKVYTSTEVKKIEGSDTDSDGEQLIITAESKKGEINISSEKVLVVTGRKPNLESLNLDEAGIDYSKFGITVDQKLMTTKSDVYAIGDVTGGVMLAHVATEEGIFAVDRIAESLGKKDGGKLIYRTGEEAKINDKVVPGCIFSFPEIAYVGLTEEEAKEKNIEYKVGKFMFGANGKAMALGETKGMVKVISNDKNVIIGVHILGPHGSDLIHEGVVAVQNELTVDDFADTIHAHPTLSEALEEAVFDLDGRAIHKL